MINNISRLYRESTLNKDTSYAYNAGASGMVNLAGLVELSRELVISMSNLLLKTENSRELVKEAK